MSTYLRKPSDFNFCCRGLSRPYCLISMILRYFLKPKFIVLSISTTIESIANNIDLIGIFARPHPYFWTIHKKPWPSKGYASKLKISSYREIFSTIDKKMLFYEHLKEIGLEKMLFRKFTYGLACFLYLV